MKRAVRISGALAALIVVMAGCAKTPPGAVTGSPTVPAGPTATSATTVTAPVPTPLSALKLSGQGIGKYDFGTEQAKVADALAKRLGDPDSVVSGETCEGLSGQWGETLVYGGLGVEFVAEDLNPTSPRTLVSWQFRVKKKLPSELLIADKVPLTLNFAELKAAYPGSASQDLGLGDGTIMLTLPNKLQFVGADTPDFVMGGDLQVCE